MDTLGWVMIAKLTLTIGDRTETMYFPTRNAIDMDLPDEVVVGLMRVVVVDLWYIVQGALDTDTKFQPEPVDPEPPFCDKCKSYACTCMLLDPHRKE